MIRALIQDLAITSACILRGVTKSTTHLDIYLYIHNWYKIEK